MMSFERGDICKARCTAPARYVARGYCLFISSMTNELQLDRAVPATGGEDRFPLPSDSQIQQAQEHIAMHLLPDQSLPLGKLGIPCSDTS